MPTILLVEDDAALADRLAEVASRHGRPVPVPTIEAARRALPGSDDWLGAIVDVGLPDGSGIELVAELRAAPLRLPVLVMTGRDERQLANDAQIAGAQFAFKPIGVRELDAFLVRAAADRPSARIREAFEAAACDAKWTARERQIVRFALDGMRTREIPRRLGVQASTCKSQIRGLLQKCSDADLDAVVRRILTSATRRPSGGD